MKKSFLLHYDSLSVIDKMSDEQVGKLMRMMKSYHNGNTYICDDFAVELVFEQFRNQFDRDLEKYQSICERNARNGSQGGRPKEPKKPTGLSGNPKKPKKADNDSDNDSDSDSDNKKDNNILFNEFWSLYPNKKGKPKAQQKYPYKDHEKVMLGVRNYIRDIETRKSMGGFAPEYKQGDTFINQKARLDYQDSEEINQMEFEAIYQEYCKDYPNNYAENRKKKYGISKDPDSLFVKVKARFNKEFIT